MPGQSQKKRRKTMNKLTLLLVASWMATITLSPVQAKDLFYATAGAGAELIAIEVQNVYKITTTLIGPTDGGSCPSLALSPWGTLYSMCGDLFGTQQLATIDPETGHATLFGVPIVGLTVMGMGFAPDGTLYAVGDSNPLSPTYNSLYTVDVGTGAFTRIGSTGAPLFFMDFTFDRDANMYGVTCSVTPSTESSTLYRLDPATGEATKIVDLVGSTSVMGLSFDRKKKKLYATDFYTNNSALYLVDIKTGFLTPIAATGYAFSHNLESAK